MSEEEFFYKIKEEFLFQVNATDEEISQRAFEEIKAQKHTLPNKIFEYKNRDKRLIFMAGSPGAGKTEIAQLLKKECQSESIDTDEIRKLCSGYSGENSHLYQKAGIEGTDILIKYAFSKGYSFILNGDFIDFNLQKQIIKKATKCDYAIEIAYVYRPLKVAKRYTKTIEKRYGKRVPDEAFIKSSLGAIETISEFIDKTRVNFYDLMDYKIIENISKEHFLEIVKDDLKKLRRYKYS